MNSRLTTAATLLALLALAACSTAPVTRESSGSSRNAMPMAGTHPTLNIPETFVSDVLEGEELDSLATWPTPDGGTWLIATAKASHRLHVFDGDTGAPLRVYGAKGDGPGEFKRPNGIAVMGDLLFVVERDNHRVQVLALPDFTPLGTFGADVLRSPYGIWLHETLPGEYDAYVTDSFMYGDKYDQVPAWDELDERVKRFHVARSPDDGGVVAQYQGAFGDTSPEAALRMVESLAGDAANGRLMVADEDRRHVSTLREYTLDGRYTGTSLPDATFGAEAEGVALWNCRDGEGYWVAVDQLAPLTVFLLFDRNTLDYVGSFEGDTTSYTDGITLHAAPTRAFTGGVLYAVHDDKAITAFDLREVTRVLSLEHNCTD
ncbi:phytase [Marilutibacter aestuarii]|nr:phytase [Lysobacter aestuarii]